MSDQPKHSDEALAHITAAQKVALRMHDAAAGENAAVALYAAAMVLGSMAAAMGMDSGDAAQLAIAAWKTANRTRQRMSN